ncbi:hsp90 co-chaperone cns1, putative [Ixodes scapularis]|uniref:Hsp90 co-chaperone cns1, putative n=1 Tax=Ixodes scapularis TaxID=6945 RepID=B7PIG5_IXOSC|nr:hsp90 co-chaperone cns1, putative [Ixodes scapularis]|eukprot:XP_002405029.1 hsp90 co-chaperone cns1, putative [Ixodes scapularis]
MDSEERNKLIEKLQQDTEDYLANCKPGKYKDGWKEETWEKEMEEHPLFASKLPEDTEMPPLVEALQQLKYDTDMNGPDELAENYKEDGNNNFKLKKYRWAVASYTEGLKQKCTNTELNAQLYCNRAAAHFRLQNYGSSLADAVSALKLKPSYNKALTRAALCSWELKRAQDCLEWCSKILKLEPGNAIMLDLKDKLRNKWYKQEERDRRKEQQRAKREAAKAAALRSALAERGIKVPEAEEEAAEALERLTPTHPALQSHRVHLSDDGADLVWPAVFLYPETMESDFVQQFDERSTFGEQTDVLFGDPGNQPEWNADGRYAPGKVTVWFKHKLSGVPVPVLSTCTLKEIILDKRQVVDNGTPSFWVLPKGSAYEARFLRETGKQ